MDLRLEFTVEPFVEGSPGVHVRAALDEVRTQGLEAEMGPFGTTVDGDADQLLPALGPIVAAALDNGASRVAVAISRRQGIPTHPFLDALTPVADALEAQVVASDDLVPGDIPLAFEGKVLAGLRLPRARGMFDRLVAEVERELGAKLSELSREDKQKAVKVLNERGVFNLRRSVEDVADALGVSRITVYNYLNAVTRREP
ncbi:MAG TPA: helix-turn-helix domain-containing protein [Acidimicrobiales bacterium]|nr:helix-turn-helix domain-containing protein [Acidimicrobiales bacterium]